MRKLYEKSGRFRCTLEMPISFTEPAVNVTPRYIYRSGGGVSAEGRHFDKAIAGDVLTELVDAGCGGWSVRAANGRADRHLS